MENNNTIWVIVGNKYRGRFGNLRFLQNKNDYNVALLGLFTDDINKAMKFTQEQKDEVYHYHFFRENEIPTFNKDTEVIDLLHTKYFFITLEELENCSAFTKKTVFEVN